MKKQNQLAESRRSASGSRSKHIVIIHSLSIATWIVAVFISVLFYIAARVNLTSTKWLAGLLLGMILLGWIMVVYDYRLSSTKNH